MSRVVVPLSLLLALAACGDKDPDDTGAAGGGDDTGGDSGEPDQDDTGEEPAPVDADGDGYAEDVDCNDEDAAVYPGAEETCNGVDDDCDADIDEDAVDMQPFFIDADGDGHGGVETEACEITEGLSLTGGDCDDEDPAVNPTATEVGCNGVDDDCDGTVDTNRVPTDHADLATAVSALPDGSEICVEPGTYAETLDLTGRTVDFIGQGGAANTILDLGTSAPVVTVGDASDTGRTSDVGFTGFTLTSGDFSAVGTDLQGGFAHVEGGTLRLTDIAFTDTAASMSELGTLSGLLVWGSDATLSLDGVSVSGIDATMSGASDGEYLEGGLVFGLGSDVAVADLTVTDVSITGDAARDYCGVRGGVLMVDEQSTLTGSDLDISGVDIDLSCVENAFAAGALVHVYDSGSTLSNVSATGNRVNLAGSSRSYLSALFRGDDYRGSTQQDWSVIDLSDNDLTTTSGFVSVIYGGLYVQDGTVSHLTFWNNTANATRSSGDRAGSMAAFALSAEDVDASYLDIRNNTGHGDAYASGIVDLFSVERDVSLRHFIIAGNSMSGTELYALALVAGAELSTFTVQHGDVVGNDFTGDIPYGTGVVAAGGEEESDLVTLDHVQVVDNTLTGDGDLHAIYEWYETGETIDVSYCNVFGHDAETVWGTISGADGNISADPLYADVSGADPTTWDLSLGSGSPAVDAGDPTRADVDGSTADLGAYGGPDGGGW